MDVGLRDKVVLVTGGASGIGRASCLAFAREGARVVVADVAVADGEATAAMIRETGGQASFVQADVSVAADVAALVRRTIEENGRLDCAHNNAGIAGPTARAADCSEEDWTAVINVNLTGVRLCMKYEIAQMVKQHAGVIVNTASTAALRGSRFASPYGACSHAIVGLTRSAALEYAADGIRVNAVCPGVIDTPMIQQRLAGDVKRQAQLEAGIPMGRMGTSEEIAQTVVWLSSNAASYVTGHVMVVDGGRTAQ